MSRLSVNLKILLLIINQINGYVLISYVNRNLALNFKPWAKSEINIYFASYAHPPRIISLVDRLLTLI